MAGIKEALRRVSDGLDKGLCLYRGVFEEYGDLFPDTKIKFMIIELEENKGIYTVFDYGGDVRISDDIKVNDYVRLGIFNNWNAKWEKSEAYTYLTEMVRNKKDV